MGAKLIDLWSEMHGWEQRLCVMFVVWLSLELMRDVWSGVRSYVVACVSRLWNGVR